VRREQGIQVRAIPQHMHQVIVNLVLNALDALADVDSAADENRDALRR
jgi:C4-dicarboxylate-specific signal transduction histidine kinase